MRPDIVIGMLQASTKSCGSASVKEKKKKTDDEIIAALKSPKKASTRFAFHSSHSRGTINL